MLILLINAKIYKLLFHNGFFVQKSRIYGDIDTLSGRKARGFQGPCPVCVGRHTTRTAAVIQVFHGRHTHVRRPSHAGRTPGRHCRNIVRMAATRAQEWFSAGKWRSGSRLHRALFYKNRLLSAPAQSRNNSCGIGRPRPPSSKVQGRVWQQYR